jgi:hypothetical protein
MAQLTSLLENRGNVFGERHLPSPTRRHGCGLSAEFGRRSHQHAGNEHANSRCVPEATAELNLSHHMLA